MICRHLYIEINIYLFTYFIILNSENVCVLIETDLRRCGECFWKGLLCLIFQPYTDVTCSFVSYESNIKQYEILIIDGRALCQSKNYNQDRSRAYTDAIAFSH